MPATTTIEIDGDQLTIAVGMWIDEHDGNFRAAYVVSDQSCLLLTPPEFSHLDDDQLLDAAIVEARRVL